MATAVKYTAGAMLVPLVAAAVLRVARRPLRAAPDARRVRRGGRGALRLRSRSSTRSRSCTRASRHQIAGSPTAAGSAKLGQSDTPGWLYYLWTLTWGLRLAAGGRGGRGRRPAVCATGAGLVLVVFPVLLFLFLGEQARHFGRWFMPAYPALCVLAGYAAVRAADAIKVRGPVVVAVLAAVLCVQGVIQAVHIDTILGREDTRTRPARGWRRMSPTGRRWSSSRSSRAWLTLDASRTFDRFPVKRPFQAYEKKLDPGWSTATGARATAGSSSAATRRAAA